jgi:hypothetical protein
MQPKCVAGLFCEDIRAERSGAFTLVGIMPDNANVPLPPLESNQHGIIPKLCLYIRVHLDVADVVKNISTRLRIPNGDVVDLGPVASNIIEKAFETSRARNSPLTIIVVRAEFPAFPVVALGRLIADVTIDQEVFVAAQLNLISEAGHKDVPPIEDVRHYSQKIVLKPTLTTEPSQPSQQLPSARKKKGRKP